MLVSIIFIMSFSAFVYGAVSAWDNFSKVLPGYNGDVETSCITRANTSSTKKYFTVKINSISNGFTAVRVWTENQYGWNFSSPSANTIGVGTSNLDYSTTPSRGDFVKLNLDNPVYTNSTPTVKGKWTPN